MAASQPANFNLQEFTDAGLLLVGGRLYTYAYGTTTQKTAYTDPAGTVPHTYTSDGAGGQYIALNARGELPAPLYLADGSYDLSLKRADGSTVWTRKADGVENSNRSFIAQLASSIGSSLMGYIQSGVGAILRTIQDELRDTINAKQFGMSTSASASVNTTALLAAITEAASRTNGAVEIPAGTYALTAGTNFATAGVAILGRGKVTLDYSAGTGIAFKLDAGGAGALVQRMRVENLHVKGGPNITEAAYIRGITRSMFRNIEVKECTTNGFALRFSVLNTFDHCVVSDDTGSMTTRPTNYWYLDDDGVTGNHTQANVFVKCEASGQGVGSTKTGWNLTNAILNKWVAGTAESCNIGVDITSDVCRMNSWEDFDMEDNQSYDARLKGISNNFYDSIAQSAAGTVVDNISISTGVNCSFFGGYYRKVNCGASSSDTSFHGVTFDDNASLGIQGAGSFNRYKCITNTGGIGGAKTGTLRDVLGPSTAATTAASQSNQPAQTVDKNEVTVTGRMCHYRARISFTAAGTAGNSIAATLDASFPAKASAVSLPVGEFIYTTSGGTIYTGVALLSAAGVLVFRTNSSTGNFGINPAVTIANGDVLTLSVNYPLE